MLYTDITEGQDDQVIFTAVQHKTRMERKKIFKAVGGSEFIS